jgi:hypothetical protein
MKSCNIIDSNSIKLPDFIFGFTSELRFAVLTIHAKTKHLASIAKARPSNWVIEFNFLIIN